MSVCTICHGEMKDGISCNSDELTVGDQVYKTIRWGDERYSGRWAIPEHCTDCNTPLGGFHHPGCCVERCPVCLGQALGCPCFDDGFDDGFDDEELDISTKPQRCRVHLFLRERQR